MFLTIHRPSKTFNLPNRSTWQLPHLPRRLQGKRSKPHKLCRTHSNRPTLTPQLVQPTMLSSDTETPKRLSKHTLRPQSGATVPSFFAATPTSSRSLLKNGNENSTTHFAKSFSHSPTTRSRCSSGTNIRMQRMGNGKGVMASSTGRLRRAER